MSNQTMVMSLSEVGWRVYRIQTSSSRFHLGVFEGGNERRPCAVLRGHSNGAGQSIVAQDSQPRVGGRPLFEVPPADWVGHVLEVGTVTTSPIRDVVREESRAIVTSITRIGNGGLVQAAEPRRQEREEPAPWAPYPEEFAERAEIAAAMLRSAYRRQGLIEDLQRDPALWERFQTALGECVLMIKGLSGRMR